MVIVAEGVAHHLVLHHPVMPGMSQPEQADVTTGGLVDRLHAPRIVVGTLRGRVLIDESGVSRNPNDRLSQWDCGRGASLAELFCYLEVAARLGSRR